MNNLSKEWIIDNYSLFFDAGDKLNGSLYLGSHSGEDASALIISIIAEMRDSGLWSQDPEQSVPDKYRQKYKDQLELVEAISYQPGKDEPLIIVRFEHEKFPSNKDQWSRWKLFFNDRFTRE
jgi:hypothetical protein